MTAAVPTGPVDTEPTGSLPAAEQHARLLEVLAAAGVELGAHDRLIVDWLTTSPGWEWSTVATIAGWVKQASQHNPN